MNRCRWIPGVMALMLAACGSDPAAGGPVATTDVADVTATAVDSASGYCDSVTQAAQVLDGGGTEVDYDDLLIRVAAESPPHHADTWSLMLQVSEQPFSYDNFNAAADSFDRIFDELAATCGGLDLAVLDDSGRIRMQPPG